MTFSVLELEVKLACYLAQQSLCFAYRLARRATYLCLRADQLVEKHQAALEGVLPKSHGYGRRLVSLSTEIHRDATQISRPGEWRQMVLIFASSSPTIVSMFQAPTSWRDFVIRCKGCRDNTSAMVETLPASWIAVKCPLCAGSAMRCSRNRCTRHMVARGNDVRSYCREATNQSRDVYLGACLIAVFVWRVRSRLTSG